MEKNYHKILKTTTGVTYNLPVYLDSTAYEMGGMVGFDGDITQVEQLVNFHYDYVSGNTIKLYNTVNRDILKIIKDETFTITWGDGNTDTIDVSLNDDLSSINHTYTSGGTYNVSIELNNSWTEKRLSKNIVVPQNISISNSTGSFGPFTLPYTTGITFTQDYINDLDNTDNDGDATIYFAAVGRSRLSELKRYGENTYQGITTSSDAGGSYTGYTIDNLSYKDYGDGTTMITGVTTNFYREEVFNQMITRNEHFIGFIDEPTIYSDVFVERGKQGVLEMNLRLGEIDNLGELDIYGNGFFQVKKQ
jgi:hypothetical protein